jgi:hypothetical protein
MAQWSARPGPCAGSAEPLTSPPRRPWRAQGARGPPLPERPRRLGSPVRLPAGAQARPARPAPAPVPAPPPPRGTFPGVPGSRGACALHPGAQQSRDPPRRSPAHRGGPRAGGGRGNPVPHTRGGLRAGRRGQPCPPHRADPQRRGPERDPATRPPAGLAILLQRPWDLSQVPPLPVTLPILMPDGTVGGFFPLVCTSVTCMAPKVHYKFVFFLTPFF